MPSKRPLSDFGLRYNPFEPGNYDNLSETFVDWARSCERALGVVANAVRQRSAKVVTVVGEEGFGKTALLKQIQNIIRTRELEDILAPKTQQDLLASKSEAIEETNKYAQIGDNVRRLEKVYNALQELAKGLANLENYVFHDNYDVRGTLRESGIHLDRLVDMNVLLKEEADRINETMINRESADSFKKGIIAKLAISLERLSEELDKQSGLKNNEIWNKLGKDLGTEDIPYKIGQYYRKMQLLEQRIRLQRVVSKDNENIKALVKFGTLIVDWTPEPHHTEKIEVFLKAFIEEILASLSNRTFDEKGGFLEKFKHSLVEKIGKKKIVDSYEQQLRQLSTETKTTIGTKASFLSLVESYLEVEKKENLDLLTAYSRIIDSLFSTIGNYFGLIALFFYHGEVFGGKKRIALRAKLTRILDANVPLVCYLAVPWTNDLHRLYSGLAEKSLPIDLHIREMFKDEDFREFIRRKLEVARYPDLKPEDPFYPFTSQSIRLVFENTMKVPLYIEYICRECIESLRESSSMVISPEIARHSIREGWDWIYRNELGPVHHAILLQLVKLNEATASTLSKSIERTKPNVSRALSSLERRMILETSTPKKKGVGAPGVKYKIRLKELAAFLAENPDSRI